MSCHAKYTLTATSQTTVYFSAYQQPTGSNASSLTSGNIAIIEGVIAIGGTGGAVQVQFASEVASSAITALAGAHLIYEALP
jgi:hypothetical protein